MGRGRRGGGGARGPEPRAYGGSTWSGVRGGVLGGARGGRAGGAVFVVCFVFVCRAFDFRREATWSGVWRAGRARNGARAILSTWPPGGVVWRPRGGRLVGVHIAFVPAGRGGAERGMAGGRGYHNVAWRAGARYAKRGTCNTALRHILCVSTWSPPGGVWSRGRMVGARGAVFVVRGLVLFVFVCRGFVGFVCRTSHLQSLSDSRVRCAHASGGCRRIRRGHALTTRHAPVGHASDTARLGPSGVLCGAWPSERSFVRVGTGGSGLGRPRVCSADVGSWRFRRWYGAVGGCSRRGSRPSWWSAAAVARCGGVCVGKLVVCELWGWGRGGLACAQ